MAKLTTDFADESSSFGSLFHQDDDEDDSQEFQDRIIGDVHFKLHCAPNDGSSPGALFAYNVWSGSVQLADYLSKNSSLVRDKKIVEFGSAAALPSLVCLSKDAKFVHITDYPNENILSAIRLNIEENADVLGSDLALRHIVQGHMWGSEIEDIYLNEYDVAIVAECLWNHSLHDLLIHSIKQFLKPGGVVFVSYAHHVPQMEAADDAFFTLAESKLGMESSFIESKQMNYMWDSSKSITQYLFEMKMPLYPRTDSDKRDELDCTPHDSESLTKYTREQAAVIAKEQEEAYQSTIILPKDDHGRVLPVTIPGPRAPHHEDHPAFGMRMWPPPKPIADDQRVPAWASEETIPNWMEE